jgi:hypothetical protein
MKSIENDIFINFFFKVHIFIVPMMTFGNIGAGIRSHNVLFYKNRFWLVGICFHWNGTMSFAISIFFFCLNGIYE